MQYLHFYKEAIGKMRAYAAKVQKTRDSHNGRPFATANIRKKCGKSK